MKNFLKKYALYLLALLALAPVMLMRDFTPDNELRYVSIAAEALRDGHVFAFFNHSLPYADKPPLYMWLCMAGYALFGRGCMAFVALFSIIPAFVLTEVLARSCRGLLSPRWLTAAKAMLLTSGLFLGLMVTMRMDMLMAMFIVLAIDSFRRMYEAMAEGRPAPAGQRWLFPLWLFLALFTKGPYGVLIPLCSTLLFLVAQRRPGLFPRIWGWRCWLLLLGLCILWFVGVYADGGKEYLDNLLFHQTVDRAVNSFHHKEPFWYYAVSVWYSIAPWSPAVIVAIIAGLFTRGARPRTSTERLYLCTVAATFILLSAMSSKLAIYLLPAFPYLIFAGALALSRSAGALWARLLLALPGIVLLAAPLLLFLIPVAEMFCPGVPLAPLAAAAAILALGGLAGLILLLRRNPRTPQAVVIMACALLTAIFAASLSLPALNPSLGYAAVVEKAEELASASGSDISFYRLRRGENIDVLTSGRIPCRLIDDPERLGLDRVADADSLLRAHTVLVVRQKDVPERVPFLDAVAPAARSGEFLLFTLPLATDHRPNPKTSSNR